MPTDTERKQFDRRTVQRYLDRGTISAKELEKHLKALPDVSDNIETSKVEQPSAFGTPAR